MNAQSSRSHAIFSITLTQRKWAGSSPPPAQPAPPASSNRASRIGMPRGASPSPGSRPMSPADRPSSRFGLRPPSVYGNSGRASPSLDEGVEAVRQHGGEASGQWVTVTSKFHFVDLAGSERVRCLYFLRLLRTVADFEDGLYSSREPLLSVRE